eukprot:6179529-Pleurochrysis_carterae.AAC.3
MALAGTRCAASQIFCMNRGAMRRQSPRAPRNNASPKGGKSFDCACTSRGVRRSVRDCAATCCPSAPRRGRQGRALVEPPPPATATNSPSSQCRAGAPTSASSLPFLRRSSRATRAPADRTRSRATAAGAARSSGS